MVQAGEGETTPESWTVSTMKWIHVARAAIPVFLFLVFPAKHREKSRAFGNVTHLPSASPQPPTTHENELFLAILICCLCLQTGLHKKRLFFAPRDRGGLVELHMDGKAIYTQRSSQCGFAGLAGPKLLGT